MAAELCLERWEAVRGRLREQLGGAKFQRWLGSVRVLSGDVQGGDVHGGAVQGGDVQGGDVHGGAVQGGAVQGGAVQGRESEGLVDGGEEPIVLEAPSPFVLEWIQAHYSKTVEQAFVEISGRPIKLKWSVGVDPDTSASLRATAPPGGEPARDGSLGAGSFTGMGAAEESRSFVVDDGDLERGARAVSSQGASLRVSVSPGEDRTRGKARDRRGGSESGEGAACRLDEFVRGPSRRVVWSAIRDVAERPGDLYNPLFIHGPSGVGKSFLLQGLCREFQCAGGSPGDSVRSVAVESDSESDSVTDEARVGDSTERSVGALDVEVPAGLRVRFVPAERFLHHYVASAQDRNLRKFRDLYRSLDVLVIDDFHVLAGKTKTLIECYHTLSYLVDAGKQVILSSQLSPREITGLDPSLVGRILSGLVVRLEKPDFGARRILLEQRAAQLRTEFSSEVLDFLAKVVRGSTRELIGAMNELDVHARIDRGPLDLDLARAVLAERLREQRGRMTVQRVAELVGEHFSLSPKLLASGSRRREIVHARHVAMYLCRRYTEKTLREIGELFGGRHHATVRTAVAKVEAELRPDADRRGAGVSYDVQRISERIES
ncbi:MAG: DnaA/Hda family protein [Planctomycetota bacterium]